MEILWPPPPAGLAVFIPVVFGGRPPPAAYRNSFGSASRQSWQGGPTLISILNPFSFLVVFIFYRHRHSRAVSVACEGSRFIFISIYLPLKLSVKRLSKHNAATKAKLYTHEAGIGSGFGDWIGIGVPIVLGNLLWEPKRKKSRERCNLIPGKCVSISPI